MVALSMVTIRYISSRKLASRKLHPDCLDKQEDGKHEHRVYKSMSHTKLYDIVDIVYIWLCLRP